MALLPDWNQPSNKIIYMDPGGTTAVVRLPQPWPPERDAVLMSVVVKQTTAFLLASSLGSFGLLLKSDDGRIYAENFQRVEVTGSGWVILSTRWNDNGCTIRLNGVELLKGDANQLPVHIVETKGQPPETPKLIYPGLAREVAQNEEEALFLATVIDLDRTILGHDWYTALRAGNSIAQLLLDGFLVGVVNRPFRVKLSFAVRDTNPLLTSFIDHGMDVCWLPIGPSTVGKAEIVDVDLEGFLKTKCLYFEGTFATVRDVIKACRNSKGGVHFGKPNTSEQTSVISLDKVARYTSVSASLDGLLGICGITLEGMRPLVNAITQRAPSAS